MGLICFIFIVSFQNVNASDLICHVEIQEENEQINGILKLENNYNQDLRIFAYGKGEIKDYTVFGFNNFTLKAGDEKDMHFIIFKDIADPKLVVEYFGDGIEDNVTVAEEIVQERTNIGDIDESESQQVINEANEVNDEPVETEPENNTDSSVNKSINLISNISNADFEEKGSAYTNDSYQDNKSLTQKGDEPNYWIGLLTILLIVVLGLLVYMVFSKKYNS